MADYNALAITTAAVAVISTEAARIANKKPPVMKPVVAGFVLGIFLFGFGLASEHLATLFCYLIIVSALLINGVALFSIVKF